MRPNFRFFIVPCFMAFAAVWQVSFAATAPLQLLNIYPARTAVAGQSNSYWLELQNRTKHAITFRAAKSASRNKISIKSRYSTCNGQLTAGQTCKLFVMFHAPNRLGNTAPILSLVTRKKEKINLSINFTVVKKTKIPKPLLQNSSAIKWKQIVDPIFDGGGNVIAIAASPTDPNILYVAVDKNMFKSVDAGKHWQKLPWGNPRAIQKILVNGDAVYVLVFEGQMYRSKDQGQHWELIGKDLLPKDWQWRYIWVHDLVIHNDILYATIYGSENTPFLEKLHGDIVYSVDQGSHWQRMGSVDSSPVGPDKIVFNGKTIFVSTIHGIYRSIDEGKSWIEANAGAREYYYHVSALVSDNGVVYVGYDAYIDKYLVYRSLDNGISWLPVSKNLGPGEVAGFTTLNHNIYVNIKNSYDKPRARYGIYELTADSDAWKEIRKGAAWNIEGIGSTLYAGLPEGAVKYQRGKWTYLSGLIGKDVKHVFATTTGILFAQTYSNSGYRLYRSMDNGKTWLTADSGFNPEYGKILQSIISTTNGDIYLLGNNFNSGVERTLYKSTDNGKSWRRVSFPFKLNLLGLVTDGSKLYVSSENKDLVSSDAAKTWQEFSTNGGVNCLARINNTLYGMGNNNTVYMSLVGSFPKKWRVASSVNNQTYLHSANAHSFSVYAGGWGACFYGIDDHTKNGMLFHLAVDVLYQSTDGGQHWRSAGYMPFLSPTLINMVSVPSANEPFTDYLLFIAAKEGVIVSNDAGYGWGLINSGLRSSYAVRGIAANKGYLFAATAAGLYHAKIPQ